MVTVCVSLRRQSQTLLRVVERCRISLLTSSPLVVCLCATEFLFCSLLKFCVLHYIVYITVYSAIVYLRSFNVTQIVCLGILARRLVLNTSICNDF